MAVDDDKGKIFLQAYDEFADAIFRYCYFRLSDRERAKELTQETFLRVWEYLSRGSAIRAIRPFLYRIAHNLIVDDFKKKKTTSLNALAETGFEPAAPDLLPTRALEASELRASLDRLDPGYREAIIMRYIEELSPREIAALIGETENNVSVRIHRGVKKLRELINEQNGK